jgi:kynurenine formamidase
MSPLPKLIDLTSTIDPAKRDLLPEHLKNLRPVIAPLVEVFHPLAKGRDATCAVFGCCPEDLPDGEGWGVERLNDMSSHCGTHVDAPLHSGAHIEGRPARTITDIALEELFRPAVVLDVRPWIAPSEAISLKALDSALEATGGPIEKGMAVLIRTGQERYEISDPEFITYPGMTREGTLHLTSQGATILGTDAFAWDRPFAVMRRLFQETKDRSQIWDGHYAIREREAFIVQKLENLGALPLRGFSVGFFPMKLAGMSAAPARVVAFID